MFVFEFRRGRSTKNAPSRRHGHGSAQRKRPVLEGLESRVVLSTSTWLGTSSAAWIDDANWSTPPVAAQDLAFPSGSSNLSNANNLVAGTSFGSFTVGGSGYAITGNSIQLSGGISSTQASGTSTISLPITLNSVATVDVTSVDATLALNGTVSGSVGLSKTGLGRLSLGGNNDYTGTTTVGAGSLALTGSASSSDFIVSGGATLFGTGSIASLSAQGGTVALGVSGPGVLSVAGSVAFSSNSTLQVALNGTDPGSGGYSQLVAASGVNLTSVVLTPSLGFTPTGNQAFTIIDNTTENPVAGTFSGLPEGANLEIDGEPFQITYVGGTGNDVVLRHLLSSTTTLQASATSLAFGQSVTFTATVSASGSTPTGSVVFSSGSTVLGTSTLNSGVATLDLNTLPIGTSSITANYQGDSSVAPSSSSATDVVVNQSLTTNVLTASPNPTVFGQLVTLTSTVSASAPGSGTPAGDVEFFAGTTSLGTATLSAGVATFTTRAIPLGNSSLRAVYAGNVNYLTSDSNTVSFGVGQSNVSNILTASPNPSTLGQSVRLTSTVTAASPGFGTPTGSVQFFTGSTLLGSALLSSGVATLDTTALTGGAQQLTAQYLGDSNFAGGTSAAVNQTVTQVATTTVLGVDPSSSVFGQSVALTATVTSNVEGTPTPTGSVEFRTGTTSLGTVALVNGVASLPTTNLVLGTNSLTAIYQGNTSYLTSTSVAVQSQVAQSQTSTALSISPSPSVVGQTLTLFADVTANSPGSGTPTGSVQFFQGTTLIGTGTVSSTGRATFTVANLPIGTTTFTAQYRGDTNYVASVSVSVPTTVSQATTTTTVSSSDTEPQAFRQVTLSANVRPNSGSGTPTGTVVFYANQIPLGAALLSSGSATLTLSTLPIGFDTITVQYFGDSNNAASTSTGLSVVVGNPNQLFINSVFQLAMSRQVDLKSMLFFENRLAAGASTSAVAFQIANSPEARRNAVSLQYEQYLGRAATPAEIRGGISSAVNARFGAKPIVLGSNDYFRNVGGGTNAGYIAALGNSILGAPFDATTQAALNRSLAAGTPRRTVATQALSTTASKQALVQSIYQTMLGRDASTSELNTAVNNLSRPGGSLRKLELTILGSEEYYLFVTGL